MYHTYTQANLDCCRIRDKGDFTFAPQQFLTTYQNQVIGGMVFTKKNQNNCILYIIHLLKYSQCKTTLLENDQ